MNEVYLSMGSLVERRNGYDTDFAKRTICSLIEDGAIDGAEFMFIKLYYGREVALAREFVAAGCRFPTFHTDKDIGAYLADAAAALEEGDRANAEELRAKALNMFRRNCETASEAGSSRLVLHLWGGLNSDRHIEYNAAALGELTEIADGLGLKILVENVPSVVTDPLHNWHVISGALGKVGLVFDTRFATCHDNAAETLSDPAVTPFIEHVHISDYRGGHKEFKCLRPVFHPGEGRADFPLIFSRLSALNYRGTFTLESPAIVGEGPEPDFDRLKRSLSFVRAEAEKLARGI